MWLFTQTGFVSTVRHYREKGLLVVRSRDGESLASLAKFSGIEIQKTPVNDYPYRLHVEESVLSLWLSKQLQELDYTNFKDRVHDVRGDEFSDALMSVWGIMHDVEDEGARK
jgi:hypothetical protein